MTEAVFCQITGRTISTEMCIDLQHSHEPEACFGCGACSRLCAKCRQRRPVNPEIGLCCACIGRQLATEESFQLHGFRRQAKGDAFCPIVSKEIPAEMCFATQGGNECQLCASAFRLCESCGKQRVYFAPYGKCLTCGLEEHAPLWLKVEHTELHRFADALQQAAERESIADMLEKSKNLVSKTGRASTNYFRQQLGLSAKKCEALLQLLEIEGVVGHLNRGNVGREVLISESPGPTPEATVDLGICEQCEQKRALVTMGLRGKRKVWCLGCVRIAFPRTWARVVAHSLNRNVIEQELFREATAIAIKNGGLSNKMLAREMQIGYGYAVKLVKILEDRGVLSREAHGEKKRRIVLISEDDFATLPILPCAVLGSKTGRSARMCNQCKQPSFPLVHLRRNYYCISCARRRFGPKWALALAHSCNRAEIMEILLEEAVKLLPSTTKITEKMLQRELVVGPQVSHELMELLEQRGMVVRVTSQGVHHRVIHLGASHEINDQPARLIQSFALNCGQHDPLYQEGKLLVIAKGKASVNFLAKSLYTSADRARRILRGLANEGIIESLSQKKDKHNKALTRLPSGDPSNSLILNLRQLVALVGKRGRVARILRDAISTLEATQHKQKE